MTSLTSKNACFRRKLYLLNIRKRKLEDLKIETDTLFQLILF